jgi:arginyl-tRNA--protein-N-Asp/Glu arginylyltransferase
MTLSSKTMLRGDEEATPLILHRSVPLVCPYLEGRIERRIVVELTDALVQRGVFDELTRVGFRRSHGMMYRPACPACNACVPVRIPARDFKRSRNFQRVWRRNQDLAGIVLTDAAASAEQYDLFRQYQIGRHGGGEMAQMTMADYVALIEDSCADTSLVEFRDAEENLVACLLYDFSSDGFSAVYSFFAPEMADRSLGSQVVLWLIEHARANDLPYVYLGYWIEDCRKMAYKKRFTPMERLSTNGWVQF